ncbi:MAG: glycoside hydrolase family 28 protein [Eubacteriales bacterium]|nr:glycoside hydrolase family 28 protein [Eubacteriales bacterium]
MEFQIIFKTSRRCTIELLNKGIYFTEQPYDVYVNGEKALTSNKVVQTVNGLKPDTVYQIEVRMGEESAVLEMKTDYEYVTLDIRRFGAVGNGKHDDTVCIQAAINSCPEHGRVYLPEGVYKVSSLFLKSNITIDFAEGAVLSAFTDRDKFPILPGLIESYDETEEYNLGTWEGNPLEMFGSILTGIHVSNVVITGQGVMDGNASFENWWKGDGREKTGGAYRPRMIFLNHCENITVQGLTVQNSPAWNLHPYFSNNTRWIDMQVINPKVSPNTDGMDPESVDGLEVVGVSFSLGDDCIAIKSGKFYMGNKYKVRSKNIMIRQCYMRHGHGSVTLGSEIAAGVENMVVKDCIFEDTDRGLRIKTRRGRGNQAFINNILFENIKMNGVLTPFVINSYYWCCDPDGHSEYVRTKEPLPVDKRTPFIGSLTFRNIEARNCHVAGSFIYGLPEAKIEDVTFENVYVDFAENPTPEYPAMMADVEPCTRKGIYINNVKNLTMRNVTVKGAEGEAMEILNTDRISR